MTAKKPAARRQRTATKELGAVVALPAGTAKQLAARPDVSWAPEVAEAWAELWTSPVGGLIKPTDVPALRRLFTFRDRQLRAQAQLDAEPAVEGSMGQPVLSPWAAEVHRLEGVIAKLEDRFGLTPLARLRLGVTFEEGVSLANRNAQLVEAFNARTAGRRVD